MLSFQQPLFVQPEGRLVAPPMPVEVPDAVELVEAVEVTEALEVVIVEELVPVGMLLFPKLYKSNLFGPPHVSWAFPLQAMSQSALPSGAGPALFSSTLSQ
jgi:hypothetical protein